MLDLGTGAWHNDRPSLDPTPSPAGFLFLHNGMTPMLH